MAIAVTNPPVGTQGFFLNATSADASGVEVLKAAVTGQSIYVTHMTISSDAGITISIGEGETVPGTIDTIFIGPVAFAANGTIQWNFLNGGMKLTAATALTVGASGAGNINVFASGYVK